MLTREGSRSHLDDLAMRPGSRPTRRLAAHVLYAGRFEFGGQALPVSATRTTTEKGGVWRVNEAVQMPIGEMTDSAASIFVLLATSAFLKLNWFNKLDKDEPAAAKA